MKIKDDGIESKVIAANVSEDFIISLLIIIKISRMFTDVMKKN